MLNGRFFVHLVVFPFVVLTLVLPHGAVAAEAEAPGSSLQILQEFGKKSESSVVVVPEKRKHEVLFFMGIALLFLVLVTAALGLAMGIFGKDVFVAHMLFAGLTVTLAIAHAIVAVVWFYPF